MNYTWASASNVGRVRAGNEDVVYPRDSGSDAGPVIVAVADGMGGAVAGEVASRLAVEAAVTTEGSPEERVAAANEAVVERIEREPKLSGMGTTLTLARFDPDGSLQIGHVGDSRAYLLRDGRLEQLTRDHSLVAELLAAGKITEEEARTHPQRNLITRSLGMLPGVRVDVIEEELSEGDRVLVCSDGLTGMIEDDQLIELLGKDGTPDETVWALVEAANEAGGFDNISVVVVDAAQ